MTSPNNGPPMRGRGQPPFFRGRGNGPFGNRFPGPNYDPNWGPPGGNQMNNNFNENIGPPGIGPPSMVNT